MPKVSASHRQGRAAVNALRALLERHDHIVQEVDGQCDFGEDLYVTFTANGQVTGDMVKVQVKGGRSWRRVNGYRVPIGSHGDTWGNSNIPLICVVHDPETDGLYWGNATKDIRAAGRNHEVLKTILISPGDVLSDLTIDDFVSRVRHYVNRCRGNQAIRTRLGEMANVDFGSFDIVQHFVNEDGEDLIFWQRRGEEHATLLHSDFDWEPERIGPKSLTSFRTVSPAIGGIILDVAEVMWLAACCSAADWGA
jgi:hypothetical protein